MSSGQEETEKVEEKPYVVGDKVLVKLSGGRLVEGAVKAISDKTDGQRLQVSFDQRDGVAAFVAGGKDSVGDAIKVRLHDGRIMDVTVSTVNHYMKSPVTSVN